LSKSAEKEESNREPATQSIKENVKSLHSYEKPFRIRPGRETSETGLNHPKPGSGTTGGSKRGKQEARFRVEKMTPKKPGRSLHQPTW